MCSQAWALCVAMDVQELRREKDHYFGHEHDSPLTVEQRAHF